MKKARIRFTRLVFLFVIGIIAVAPIAAVATPQAPGYVPSQVGDFQAARELCEIMPLPSWIMDLITFYAVRRCHDALNIVDENFVKAYRDAERAGTSPGYPTNDVHFWQKVAIQDFTGGTFGKGAIMMRGQQPKVRPQYVGGSIWSAFKVAANQYGVFPGYPSNTLHTWNRVQIQDFREGDWGEGAIISDSRGQNAGLVAGRHWKAYKRVDGSNRLRAPITFVNQTDGGWLQMFEGGEIWESGGSIKVYFYDNNRWENFWVN